MNKIILTNVNVDKTKIIYNYEITGQWETFFTKKRSYSIDYHNDLNNVPKSILNIPFILNFLPMIWLFDGEMMLDEIDSSLEKSISDIKKGYTNMYPKLDFKGKISFNEVADNTYEPVDMVGAFFSGGLDATSTLVSHYHENPILINLQGSDISLKYQKVIDGVRKFLKTEADHLELNINFITSEFRTVLNERNLNKYIKDLVHDNYWHAFQHGIAIISHSAPISYINKLKCVYIASSFTKDDHVPCASDPTIDNFVKFSSTNIIHDGYEFNRQDKSENVAKFIGKENKKIKLRVCLDDYRIDNCCHCEKCYRTIFGFASKGFDPSIVGFDLTKNDYKKIEKDIKNRIIIEFIPYWINIKNEFLKHPELKNDERFSWIFDADFKELNRKPIKKLKKFAYKFERRFKLLCVKIDNWCYLWKNK